jgi:hypothetical protein
MGNKLRQKHIIHKNLFLLRTGFLFLVSHQTYIMQKCITYCLFLFLCSCTAAYFKTPNDVSKKEATIFLNNGTQLKGKISVSLEKNFAYFETPPDYIELFHDNKTPADRIPLRTITAYTIDSDYYALKLADILNNGSGHLLFVKRLTAANSRMQVYMLHQSGIANATGEESTEYFISLPTSEPYETMNVKSSRIIPDFDLKMSSLLHDCPALADKIRAKEKGYYLPAIIFNNKKREEVFMQIANDYNNCK